MGEKTVDDGVEGETCQPCGHELGGVVLEGYGDKGEEECVGPAKWGDEAVAKPGFLMAEVRADYFLFYKAVHMIAIGFVKMGFVPEAACHGEYGFIYGIRAY